MQFTSLSADDAWVHQSVNGRRSVFERIQSSATHVTQLSKKEKIRDT
jgi:hypothetical protein